MFHTARDAGGRVYSTHSRSTCHGEPSLAGPETAPGSRAALAGSGKPSSTLPALLGPRAADPRRRKRSAGKAKAATPGQRRGDKSSVGRRRRDHGQETLRRRRRPYLEHGSVVIAAITSCTNTSNPSVMVAAGLLAKKAVEKRFASSRGSRPAWRPARGSSPITSTKAGLLGRSKAALQPRRLRLHDLHRQLRSAAYRRIKSIDDHGLVVAVAVLSGNRNFEGRINSEVRANYLMSPPLVVAYALAGKIGHQLRQRAARQRRKGQPVYPQRHLADPGRSDSTIAVGRRSEMFTKEYATVTEGDENWQKLKFPRAIRISGSRLDLHPQPALF